MAAHVQTLSRVPSAGNPLGVQADQGTRLFQWSLPPITAVGVPISEGAMLVMLPLGCYQAQGQEGTASAGCSSPKNISPRKTASDSSEARATHPTEGCVTPQLCELPDGVGEHTDQG